MQNGILIMFLSFIVACGSGNKVKQEVNSTQNQDSKMEIVYFGDPMCSWCYGFTPELKAVQDAYPDADFRVVLGGLRPYGTETMASLKDFLHEHWEEIGGLTGQPFSYDILENENFIYDTEPACRAVRVVRELKPEVELQYFKDLQTAFYKDNRDITNFNVLADIARKHGLNIAVFENLFLSEPMKSAVKDDFMEAKNRGITGFPSMMVFKNGEGHYVSRGYGKAEKLIEKIAAL